ncbi:hypothetical protein PG984_016450 [Apiospora sp. TS-2023a]
MERINLRSRKLDLTGVDPQDGILELPTRNWIYLHTPGIQDLGDSTGTWFRRRVKPTLYGVLRDPLICKHSIITTQALLLVPDTLLS